VSGATTGLRPDVDTLVIAGWTGRSRDAVEAHIRELEAIGVPRPRSVPLFYRVAASNLTSAPRVEVVGGASSGEVEFVLVSADDGLWVGVGSDHTDRELEKRSVAASKQVCVKPVGTSFWRYEDVAAHWDALELRSHVGPAGGTRLYQHGSVGAIRAPQDLIERYCGAATLPVGTAMYGGTLPVHGAVGFADRYELELIDPVRGRTLRHVYEVTALPVIE
jgi:hypothetical protein